MLSCKTISSNNVWEFSLFYIIAKTGVCKCFTLYIIVWTKCGTLLKGLCMTAFVTRIFIHWNYVGNFILGWVAMGKDFAQTPVAYVGHSYRWKFTFT